jgi:hypothetical protein
MSASEMATMADVLLRDEERAKAEFRQQMHLHLGSERLPDDQLLETWALMQHHGAPTRLLDWSLSPFVAAYFAVERDPDQTGIVYAVDTVSVLQIFQDFFHKEDGTPGDPVPELQKPDAPKVVFFWQQTGRRPERSIAQQGLFSVTMNIAGTHTEMFWYAQNGGYHPTVEPAARWLFPPEIKTEMLRNLRLANIAAHALFPGLDGLGRSINESVRIGEPLTFNELVAKRQAELERQRKSEK